MTASAEKFTRQTLLDVQSLTPSLFTLRTQAIDSPFYGVSLAGIEKGLLRANYSPLFVSGHWNASQEARCIDMLRSRRVDGIIVLTGRLSDAALKHTARSLPVVPMIGLARPLPEYVTPLRFETNTPES